jgi:NAD(P)-dependent dehydrogenase (short-subunit alcohol dehydrogenase family)
MALQCVADETEALAQFAVDSLGRLDIWINNAGISQREKTKLQETPPEHLKQVLDTNLFGSILGTWASLKVCTWASELYVLVIHQH